MQMSPLQFHFHCIQTPPVYRWSHQNQLWKKCCMRRMKNCPLHHCCYYCLYWHHCPLGWSGFRCIRYYTIGNHSFDRVAFNLPSVFFQLVSTSHQHLFNGAEADISKGWLICVLWGGSHTKDILTSFFELLMRCVMTDYPQGSLLLCCCRPHPSTEEWGRGPTTVSTHTGRRYPPIYPASGTASWLVAPLHSSSRCPTSTGAVHKSVACSCVFMLVQLNKCVVCGSNLQRAHSGDGCLSLSILFKYERCKGHLFVLSWARVRRVARGSVVSEYSLCTVSGMVVVTLLCCRLLRYVLTMVVWMCFMFVLILASSMVLRFVWIFVV